MRAVLSPELAWEMRPPDRVRDCAMPQAVRGLCVPVGLLVSLALDWQHQPVALRFQVAAVGAVYLGFSHSAKGKERQGSPGP
jgi:hypothetical protein